MCSSSSPRAPPAAKVDRADDDRGQDPAPDRRPAAQPGRARELPGRDSPLPAARSPSYGAPRGIARWRGSCSRPPTSCASRSAERAGRRPAADLPPAVRAGQSGIRPAQAPDPLRRLIIASIIEGEAETAATLADRLGDLQPAQGAHAAADGRHHPVRSGNYTQPLTVSSLLSIAVNTYTHDGLPRPRSTARAWPRSRRPPTRRRRTTCSSWSSRAATARTRSPATTRSSRPRRTLSGGAHPARRALARLLPSRTSTTGDCVSASSAGRWRTAARRRCRTRRFASRRAHGLALPVAAGPARAVRRNRPRPPAPASAAPT